MTDSNDDITRFLDDMTRLIDGTKFDKEAHHVYQCLTSDKGASNARTGIT